MSVERADFPADAPKIALSIGFNPEPYFYTLDGKPVVEHAVIANQPISDEIVVEITNSLVILEERGGERGNRFTYKIAFYTGVAIENLTHPDRLFESE